SIILLTVALATTAAHAAINVDFSVKPDNHRHTISPLIYGSNQDLDGGENFGLYRLGGNRTTGYNWENNASNAGHDWHHSSDDYLTWVYGIEDADENTPGITMTHFHDRAVNAGAKSLLTLQMAGYVAKDKDGDVAEGETAPSARWVEVIPKKNAPFALMPDLTDNAVYIDEIVNFLVNRYGRADEGGVLAYSLDNEPALWSQNHPRIHPAPAGAQELVERSVTTAAAVKDVDPSAQIFGPALYGFAAFNHFQNAPDWPALSGSYTWFIDYYLAQMKAASDGQGRRLLDVLDVHWYPEATGDHRITLSEGNTRNDKIARLQAPRTLWDPDYRENSWIAQSHSDFLPLLPRLQNAIDSLYPGTRLAITEFNYGAAADITGGVAIADVLGIFGKYNLYAANYWKLGDDATYVSLAYKLFRNYDGNNSTFGNVSVDAEMSDKVNSSVYASVNDGTGNLHVVVLNKHLDETINGSFNIDSDTDYRSANVYTMTGNAAALQKPGGVSISGNTFSYAIPPVSAQHFVISVNPAGSSSSGGPSSSPEGGSDPNGEGSSGWLLLLVGFGLTAWLMFRFNSRD
ncbi:MAG TPA: glycoside hydrolase family 44 protein, partial [Gammaproteobacteria bacterium]